MTRNALIVFVFILLGVVFRLFLTANGNFIFNMDNARDMVDVREMVVLGKPRLIGPTTGIEGFFTGPGWYYLLAIPFILSQGHPYALVLTMIFFWALGGYFLLKLTSRWGVLPLIAVGSLWVSSNYVVLATLYSYNPNPVLLLTPLFIFVFEKYLQKGSIVFSVLTWAVVGILFNCEMAFAIFYPPVIILAIWLLGKGKYFLSKSFAAGFLIFVLSVLPQVIFDFRHDFLMFKSILNNISGSSNLRPAFNLDSRFAALSQTYLSVFSGTFMNVAIFVKLALTSLLLIFLKNIRDGSVRKDTTALISLLLILVPFAGYLVLPMNVMQWHLGGSMAAAIILVGFVIAKMQNLGKAFGLAAIVPVSLIAVLAINNLEIKKNFFEISKSQDPSSFVNEIAAIDYVYKYADGKNFKVYSYIPSVIDYPYQYLFWWHGQKKYGYTPKEYFYLPNQPEYIKNKDKFNSKTSPVDSGLTFLIMEPDKAHPERMELWKNYFRHLKPMSSEKIGPLFVEAWK